MEDAERVRCDALRNVVLDGNSHANWNKFMMPHYHYSLERQKRAELQKGKEESQTSAGQGSTPIAMALKAPTVFNFNSSMFPPVKPLGSSSQLRMDRSPYGSPEPSGPHSPSHSLLGGSLGGQTLGAALGATASLGQGGSPLNLGSTISLARARLDTHGQTSAHVVSSPKVPASASLELNAGGSVSPPPLRTRLSALAQPSRARSSTHGRMEGRSSSSCKSPVRSSSGPGLPLDYRSASPHGMDVAFGNMAEMGLPGGFNATQPLQSMAWTSPLREGGVPDRLTPPEKMASATTMDRQINSMLQRSRSLGPRVTAHAMGQP